MEFFVLLMSYALFVFYLAEFWNEKLLKPVQGSTRLYVDGPHSNPIVNLNFHLDLFWMFLNFDSTNQISSF